VYVALATPVNVAEAWYVVPLMEYSKVPDAIDAVIVIVPLPAIPLQPATTFEITGTGLTVAVTAIRALGQVPLKNST
jgi:hypothetical protein